MILVQFIHCLLFNCLNHVHESQKSTLKRLHECVFYLSLVKVKVDIMGIDILAR